MEKIMTTTKQEAESSQTLSSMLIAAASFVVVIAGMRSAQSIIVPFLLAIFVAIICGPMLLWFNKKGLSRGLSLLLVIIGVLAIGGLFAVFIGTSIQDFSVSLPFYQERLVEKMTVLIQWAGGLGLHFSDEMVAEYFDPGALMGLVANMLSSLGGMMSNSFLILLTVIFILLEAASFPDKLHAAFGSANNSLEKFEKFIANVNRYMAIKTWVSLVTGALVTAWLLVLGIDFPLLWGVIAFLLNFVPNIGSIIASVPAILLALVQFDSGTALLVALGYVVVNIVIGSGVEPRFLGRGLGISTLVVFLSLVFWGWVFGPVGMFLSIPLTMTLKIGLSSNKNTRWVSILLGSAEE